MMESKTMRIDAALTMRGLTASREKAQALIRAGLVQCNGAKVTKCSEKVTENDELIVLGALHPYVSRGGLKLEHALRTFQIPVRDCVCLDVGASTGGFTDVLLQNGAAFVYAIDVGQGQLDAKIASDARVCSMEKTNARTLTVEMFSRQPRLAVMDVSFISIRLILPALFDTLGENGTVISLIKPQFEAGAGNLGKHGIVSDSRVHEEVLRAMAAFPEALGWRMTALTYSPIHGGDGNTEFLACFRPIEKTDSMPPTAQDIHELVLLAKKSVE